MTEQYTPPFTMTDEIVNMVIEIGEMVGQLSAYNPLSSNLKLRRENRIKTIHSSLAIENNTLTIDQVTDIINGKRVLAPPQDIHEAKNAYAAYEEMQKLNPYSLSDLLKAHRFMTEGLIKEAGRFRSQNAGVYVGDTLIHAGSPANYVPELMQDLFVWLRQSALHPLIKSCIFHYEFEFIHPFQDGNGRTGRLWHSLILQSWKPFFAWIPIETIIYEHQKAYYDAINSANNAGESTVFVTFMLRIIHSTLHEFIQTTSDKNVGSNVGINVGINYSSLPQSDRALALLRTSPKMTTRELAELLGLSSRQVERLLSALKASGRLARVGANRNGTWQVLD